MGTDSDSLGAYVYVGSVGDKELTGGLYNLLVGTGDVGSITVYEELFSFEGENVSGLYTSSDDSRFVACSVVKCLYVLTCFLKLDGSV